MPPPISRWKATIITKHARALTPGEVMLARRVFGTAIDLEPVRICRAKWWFLQPAWIVMAPDGHIWFHPNNPAWREDFSAAHLGLRGLIVHEMTHVWQHQQGINLVLKRLPFARYDYLPLKPGKPFEAYGLEQQAEIVRDAYVLSEGGQVPGAPPLSVYASLIPFGEWRPRAGWSIV